MRQEQAEARQVRMAEQWLLSTGQVASTWGSSPVWWSRAQAGQPERSRLWLELALLGELQPQEPTRQPQPIPGTPARATAGAPAGASKPLRGQGVWEVPSSPPARPPAPR